MTASCASAKARRRRKEPYTSGIPTNIHYTRAGDLTTNPNGFLTTQSGEYVIGRNAVATEAETGDDLRSRQRRHLHRDPARLVERLDRSGRLGQLHRREPRIEKLSGNASPPDTSRSRRSPTNPDWNAWAARCGRQTANSGTPIVGTPDTPGFGATIGGELEMSNVDLATEMTNMITAERGYQANSRVISTADEMLETLVTMVQ